jgi:hypothetical protein
MNNEIFSIEVGGRSRCFFSTCCCNESICLVDIGDIAGRVGVGVGRGRLGQGVVGVEFVKRERGGASV